jgi:membrane associated rhomboid family serine protease
MAVLADLLLLELLKAIERSAPEPVYPAALAAYTGLERSLLDEALDHLRLRGLVQLTDWVQGKGQGYALTSQGEMVLRNPGYLKRARLPVPPMDGAPPPDRSVTPWGRGEAVRESLLNPVRPIVCMTLIALNILMFVFGLFLALHQGVALSDYLGSGNGQVNRIRDELGALIPPEVLAKGEWWRLLSYAFVHGGLLHILVNMYSLFAVGPLLETMWGRARFLILYLVGALTGGCAVMLTMRGAVGASGALCGLLTSLGVWVYLNRNFLPSHIASSWMRNVFTNIVLIAVISIYFPGVSWEGHLGGAIGGALVSVPLNYHRFGMGWQKILGLAGMTAVPMFSVGLVVRHLEPIADEVKVERYLYPYFRTAEKKAVDVYSSQARPLWAFRKNEIGKPHLAAALEAFQDAQQQLQEALEMFDKLRPYRDEDVADAVQKATAYLEEWSRFYALFAKMVATPPPWPPEQMQAQRRQLQNIVNAGRRLENSPLLPLRFRIDKQAGQ